MTVPRSAHPLGVRRFLVLALGLALFAPSSLSAATPNLTGLIRLPSGSAAAGAIVSGVGVAAVAGTDGRFSATAPVGAVRITAAPADPNPQHLLTSLPMDVVIGATPQDVTLDLRAPTVVVTVRTSTGAVVPDGFVSARRRDGAAAASTDVTGGTPDAGGAVGLLLSPGPWTLLVSPPVDGDPWQMLDTTADIDVVDAAAILRPAVTMALPTLKARLLSVAGTPIYGADATAEDDASGSDIATSDVNGHLGWRLPAGDRRVWARPPAGSAASVLGVAASVTVPSSGAAGPVDLRLRDRSVLPWAITPISVRPDGSYAAGSSRDPVVSGDGTSVAFLSQAGDLVSGLSAGTTAAHLYRRDVAAGSTSLVDVALGGAPGTRLGLPVVAAGPATSSDGRFIAFSSAADDLIASDVEAQEDVFLRDVAGGATVRVSESAGHGGDASSTDPSVSGDGSSVAFLTGAGNLSGGAFAPSTATTLLLWRTSGIAVVATAALGALAHPVVSADGSTVVFSRRADDGSWSVQRWTAGLDAALLGAQQALGISGAPSAAGVSADGATVTWVAKTASSSTARRWTQATGGVDIALPATPYGGGSGVRSVLLSSDASTLTYVATGLGGQPQAFRRTSTGTLLASTGPEGLGASLLGTVTASVDARSVGYGQDGIPPAGGGTNRGKQVFLARLTTDAGPPAWPAGAVLSASEVGGTFAVLGWSAATDDVGVTGYTLTGGPGSPVALAADARGTTVTGLIAGTGYDFSLTARDAAGGTSLPLSLHVDTPAPPLPGDAALSAVTAPSGFVHLQWDAVAGATSYVIDRTTDGGTATRVATLPAGSSSWDDVSTAAGSVHTYRVGAVINGTEQPLTVTATAARIPALSLTSVSVTPQLFAPGVALLGTDVVLAAAGSPGRHVVAQVTSQDSAGAATTTDHAMTEPAAGSYRALFHLADDVGRVTAVKVVLDDTYGSSTERSAAGLPFDVSGLVVVTITGDDLPGFRLAWSSDAARASSSRPVDGTSFTLPVAGAADWRLRMSDVSGFEPDRVGPLAIARGSRMPVTLDLHREAEIRLRYQLADGTPLSGIGSTLSDGTSAVSWAQSDVDGRVASQLRLPEGLHLTVKSTYLKAVHLLLPIADRDVVASVPGTAPTVVVIEQAQVGRIGGTVRNLAGEPLRGVQMTLTQTIPGAAPTTQSTGVDGTYLLDGYGGPAVLSTGRSGSILTDDVLLTVGSTLTHDVVLPASSAYFVDVQLRTRQPGDADWQGPLTLDPSTQDHLRLSLQGPGLSGHPMPLQASPPTGPFSAFIVTGAAGGVVTACINGSEAYIPDGCGSIVLGDDFSPVLHLDLGYVEGVKATVSSPIPVQTTLFSEASDGALTQVGVMRRQASPLTWGLPSPGRYVVRIDDGLGTAVAHVDVAAGQVIDLGALTLAPAGQFRTASAVTGPLSATPGSLVPFRVAVHNSATSAAPAAVARVAVPDGTSLPPEGVLVGGVATATTAGAGWVDVPLGTIAAGADRILLYQLRLSPGLTADTVLGDVAVRADGMLSDALGLAVVQVVRLTLNPPQPSSSRTQSLKGRAPAGAPVSVVGANGVLATAVATASGFWSASVTLPDIGAASRFVVRAETGTGDALQRTPDAALKYDPDTPEMVDLSLRQDAYANLAREIHVDPRLGLARFVFVFTPGIPQIVTATFTHPERVHGVVMHAGAASAPATLTDGHFVARLDPPDGHGSIYVEYVVDPLPFQFPTRTEDQIRAGLPVGMTDFVVASEPVPEAVEGGGRLVVDALLPSIGASAHVRTEVIATDSPDFVPTAEQLASIESTGIPVLGVETTSSADGSTVTVSGYTPSLLFEAGSTAGSSTAGLRRKGAAIRAASLAGTALSSIGAWSKTEHWTVKVVDAGIAAGTGSQGAYNTVAGNNYATIDSLYDLVGTCSDPVKAAASLAAIDHERWQQVKQDVVSTGAQFVGGAAGSALVPGLGTAIGFAAGGIVMDWALNALSASRVAALESQIRTDCPGGLVTGSYGGARASGDWGPYGPPVATPGYVYDPSGVVYEGTPSNLLDGVTSTLLQGDTENGPWHFWSAPDFGQTNPLLTDGTGRYAWDVPEGWWKVVWSKPGYASSQSPALSVLPPRLGVDGALVRLSAPVVSDVVLTPADAGFEVTFDRPMRTSTMTDVLAVTKAGAPVAGAWTPVDPQPGVGDVGAVSSRVRFVPAAPLATSTAYTVDVGQTIEDYARRTMVTDVTRTLTTAAAPVIVPLTEVPGPTPSASPVSPPPSASSGPDCSPLTVYLLTVPVVAGRPASLAVAGAPGPFELVGYTRPDLTYRVLRTLTVPASGWLVVPISPTRNSRFLARQLGCMAGATTTAMPVRAAVSLAQPAVVPGGRVLSGSVLPRRAGMLVRLTWVDARHIRRALCSARTDSRGHYACRAAFSQRGSYSFLAQAPADTMNAAGTSDPRTGRV